MKISNKIIDKCICIYNKYRKKDILSRLGHCGENVILDSLYVYNPQNIFLYDNTNILQGFTFISHKGRFFFHEGSSSANNLTVITDSHVRVVGKKFKDPELFYNYIDNVSDDVIVEDEVWIGANVILLPGTKIGRGSTIGAGSVVRGKVPPYSIVTGNPAKITGFSFTPEEIIEHEKVLYSEGRRLPLEILEKNYEKYFLKRIKEIKQYTRL